MNDDYLSITELAKLRKVSSETLRYYDRINLLKPEYIDPETRYRYYSVRQSEKLGVIRELRELGMSVEEVKDYFKDCNLRKYHTDLLRILLKASGRYRKKTVSVPYHRTEALISGRTYLA